MRVTLTIAILCILVQLTGQWPALWLWPLTSPEYRWWQPLTYGLVHGGWLHLALNLLALLSFGPALERAWGWARFLGVYALAAALGGVLQAWTAHSPVVGASASLFGLFAAYTVANPNKVILPFMLPAWIVLACYALVSMLAWWSGWMVTVAHVAHLGGISVGLACAGYFRFGGKR